MKKVRAKVICVASQEMYKEQKLVEFQAVVDGSKENESFAKYTPNLVLQSAVSDETEAADAFEVNKEYYIDFTPAE